MNAQESRQERLAGVALALPALERAAKLQRRAARVGFDWPDASGPRSKVDEELAELDAEQTIRVTLRSSRSVICRGNLARHLNIEPEAALREANRKFEKRFRSIEQAPGFADLPLEEKEALWVEANKVQAETPTPETAPNRLVTTVRTAPTHHDRILIEHFAA